MSSAVMFLADGFEEVEALTAVDLLRRAGVEVTTVSISGQLSVTGRSRISVLADTVFDEAETGMADLLILPGGQPGTSNLMKHEGVAAALKKAAADGRKTAAICAGPTVLGHLGLLKGRKAACYPGCEGGLDGAEVLEEKVVTDGNVITSRGAGTAVPFALALIEALEGREEADRIAESIVWKC